jgi:hypothetical protein
VGAELTNLIADAQAVVTDIGLAETSQTTINNLRTIQTDAVEVLQDSIATLTTSLNDFLDVGRFAFLVFVSHVCSPSMFLPPRLPIRLHCSSTLREWLTRFLPLWTHSLHRSDCVVTCMPLTTRQLIKAVREDFGKCGPFIDDYDNLTDALCGSVVGGIQAIWISFALVAFFTLILTWLALKVGLCV